MNKLTRADLLSLEQYAEQRDDFRRKVMAHKKPRRIGLGDHITLCFEDRLTMQYQIQEMLRAERIFEAAGIDEELDAYNPLIPDGDNWKATLLIEYADVEERVAALVRLVGIEDALVMRVGDRDPVALFADEDLEREREEKTAAVHFIRLQPSAGDIEALRAGELISIGVNHPEYQILPITLEADSQRTLCADLGLEI